MGQRERGGERDRFSGHGGGAVLDGGVESRRGVGIGLGERDDGVELDGRRLGQRAAEQQAAAHHVCDGAERDLGGGEVERGGGGRAEGELVLGEEGVLGEARHDVRDGDGLGRAGDGGRRRWLRGRRGAPCRP